MPGSFTKFVGDTLEPYAIIATDNGGNTVDLTGAALTLELKSLQGGGTTVGTGNWTISNAAMGMASYAWSPADLATAGLYLVYTVVTVSGNVLTLEPVLCMIRAFP